MKKYLIYLGTCIYFMAMAEPIEAQMCAATAPVCVPGNGYAFQYANDTLFGLVFNTSTIDYEFTNGSGNAVVGFDAITGNLSFPQGGALQVDGNEYAFQFSGDADYGLYFNANQLRYEFRTSGPANIFSIGANTGNVRLFGHFAPDGDSGNPGQILASKGSGTPPEWVNFETFVDSSMALCTKITDSIDSFFLNIDVLRCPPDGTSQHSRTQAIKAWTTIFSTPMELVSVNALKAFGDYSNIYFNRLVSPSQTDTFNTVGINLNAGTIVQSPGNLLAALDVVGYSSSNSTSALHVRNSSDSSLMFIRSDGMVGLGTDNPNDRLAVNGTTYLGGLVGIGAPPLVGVDLRVTGPNGGLVQIGSAERIRDGGNNTLVFQAADLDPNNNVVRDIGAVGAAWDDIRADAFVTQSDRRLKSNISTCQYGLTEVMQLKPVAYVVKADPQQEKKLGLIAQEVLQVIPEAVKTHDMVYDEEGNMTIENLDLLGMQYSTLIPVLVNAIKEQQNVIMSKDRQLTDVQNQMKDILQRLDRLEENAKTRPGKNSRVEVDGKGQARLDQNRPNPFQRTTTIPYRLPDRVGSAQLLISGSSSGNVVKSIRLEPVAGENTIEIIMNEFSSGQFSYTLVVDGLPVDTKQFVFVSE